MDAPRTGCAITENTRRPAVTMWLGPTTPAFQCRATCKARPAPARRGPRSHAVRLHRQDLAPDSAACPAVGCASICGHRKGEPRPRLRCLARAVHGPARADGLQPAPRPLRATEFLVTTKGFPQSIATGRFAANPAGQRPASPHTPRWRSCRRCRAAPRRAAWVDRIRRTARRCGTPGAAAGCRSVTARPSAG